MPARLHAQQPQPAWVADGVTEYTLYIYVDNRGLGGEETHVVEWKLSDILGLSYVDGSSSAPDINDFFDGYSIFWEDFDSPLMSSARVVSANDPAPVDEYGYVGMYRLVVPVGFPAGVYGFSFNPEDTYLHGDQGYQQFTITNEPLYIAPVNPADFDFPPLVERDGYINAQDFSFFESAMNGPDEASVADIDGSGCADVLDLARLQRCFTGSTPLATEVCD